MPPGGTCFNATRFQSAAIGVVGICDTRDDERPTVYKDGVSPPIKVDTTFYELQAMLSGSYAESVGWSHSPPG